MPPGQDIDGFADASTDISGGDSTTTRDLLAAEFALLSPGPDRGVNLAVRRDQAGLNEDNLVKVGR